MSDSEHLVRIRLKDGGYIDFFRDENNDVRITSPGQEIKMPKATGMMTTQLFAMIEPLGEIEYEEDDDYERES